MVGRTNFPYCCGADILSDFSSEHFYGTKERIDDLSTRVKNHIRKKSVAWFLAIISENQLDVKKVLEKNGFELLCEDSNPNSGNIIYLYIHRPKRRIRK